MVQQPAQHEARRDPDEKCLFQRRACLLSDAAAPRRGEGSLTHLKLTLPSWVESPAWVIVRQRVRVRFTFSGLHHGRVVQ